MSVFSFMPLLFLSSIFFLQHFFLCQFEPALTKSCGMVMTLKNNGI